MEKVRIRLYQLTLLLTLISVTLVLVSSGRQREFFYFAVYASIIGLLVDYKKISLRPFSIALPLLLIGILNLAWYFSYEFGKEGINTYNSYFGASKKLILGSILVFYLDQFKSYVTQENVKKHFLLATGIGLALATAYGFWQASQGIVRVEMCLNRATIAAYIYSVLSLSFIYSLYVQKKKSAYFLAGVVIMVSYVIILMTGTRAAMGLFIILAIVMTLYHFKKIHIKSSLVFLCIVSAIIAFGYKPYIEPKLHQTTVEISKFQEGQDNTSLGARFSMWAVGVENGIFHPMGQSTESRKQWSGEYVKINPHLRASMLFMDIHLHNEFVEKYSLQGIPGIVLLLFFFATLLSQALKKRNGLLLMATLFLFLYGLTDVILLSSEAMLFFLAIFALSTHFYVNESKKTV
ncbi:O-antigen ligase family protein [Scandinavium sp. H11S7]|uniref:O-antigen ligase family protein n=1 Tax=Scandinavium hiltneri TaxID=2926519 RepID=UPI00216555A3|nr:O-antigen ligase family protein [Scandinavium hiltneri]MCS2157606.1 O-antigen ligase family protein [Scandinavium hiltneri]